MKNCGIVFQHQWGLKAAISRCLDPSQVSSDFQVAALAEDDLRALGGKIREGVFLPYKLVKKNT